MPPGVRAQGGTMGDKGALALLKNRLRRLATHAARCILRPERVIVSLTSYPGRIGTVHLVVRSLFAQLALPDKVVLYLSSDEFPHAEKDLPPELLDCVGFDFEIRWVDGNMRSHKKYLYAVRDFPDALIITVDDDIECRNTLVGDLVEAHRRFPKTVPGARCHIISFGEDGRVRPYGEWVMESGNRYPRTLNRPSMRLCPTSGAGMLLAPGSLPPAAFDEQAIREICLDADDLWLKVMTALAGWPSVSVPGRQDVVNIAGTQVEALWYANSRGGNDRAFALLRMYFADCLGVPLVDSLLRDDGLDVLMAPGQGGEGSDD